MSFGFHSVLFQAGFLFPFCFLASVGFFQINRSIYGSTGRYIRSLLLLEEVHCMPEHTDLSFDATPGNTLMKKPHRFFLVTPCFPPSVRACQLLHTQNRVLGPTKRFTTASPDKETFTAPQTQGLGSSGSQWFMKKGCQNLATPHCNKEPCLQWLQIFSGLWGHKAKGAARSLFQCFTEDLENTTSIIKLLGKS